MLGQLKTERVSVGPVFHVLFPSVIPFLATLASCITVLELAAPGFASAFISRSPEDIVSLISGSGSDGALVRFGLCLKQSGGRKPDYKM